MSHGTNWIGEGEEYCIVSGVSSPLLQVMQAPCLLLVVWLNLCEFWNDHPFYLYQSLVPGWLKSQPIIKSSHQKSSKCKKQAHHH